MLLTIQAKNTFYIKQGATGDGSSWAKASGNIQIMIDKASIGDEVWIAMGEYAGFKNKDGISLYGGFKGSESKISDRVKKDNNNNGTIESWEFTSQTIIKDVSFSHQIIKNKTYIDGIIFRGGDGFYISGKMLIVRNCIFEKLGYASGSDRSSIRCEGATMESCVVRNNKGRGIYNIKGIIRNCYISENRGFNSGGGIYNESGTVENCIIYNNILTYDSSAKGAGVYNITDKYSTKDIATLLNCEIFDNKFDKTNNNAKHGSGGGVYNTAGLIENCKIYNHSAYSGGGIYNSSLSMLFGRIKNSHVYNNNAWSGGGGIYNYQGGIENTIIHSNNIYSDTNVKNYGGGVYLQEGASISYSHIYNNSAYYIDSYSKKQDGIGSGIALFGGSITSCIINNNSYTGVYRGATAKNSPNIHSSTIVNNKTNVLDSQINNPSKSYLNNCIIDNTDVNSNFIRPTSFVGLATTKAQQDELFNVNWDLKHTSKYVDAGNSSTSAIEFDYAGNPRVVNGIIDLGAYECQNSTSGIRDEQVQGLNIYLSDGYIRINTDRFISSIQLFDMNGYLLSQAKKDIKLPNKGVYILKIQIDSKSIIKKIIW